MPLLILIADDDPGIRLSVSDYLELSGYSVIAAANGQEALKLVEEYQPHLVVTDIAMPNMDGYELVQRVRQRPVFRLLPVIFLTAHTATKERIRGYQMGCDAYLAKPFDLDELGAVVRNLLERSQMIESEWRSRVQASELYSDKQSDKPEGFIRHSASPPLDFTQSLSQREQEVLELLSAGFSNIQIGDNLHLSPRTVEKYVSSLLRKTETSNRAELVRFAMEHNLVS
ncbi:MAG: response regulator transcription factor [Scytolyngbya sp. HA4215-MV1]|jgi:DNA-binding NarL/FixJ family response regulator|nr:response regulator transcription factor [Scytolyngbya sp. HA4215-MV1]